MIDGLRAPVPSLADSPEAVEAPDLSALLAKCPDTVGLDHPVVMWSARLVDVARRLDGALAAARSEYDTLALSFERFELREARLDAVSAHVEAMCPKGCCGWHREKLRDIISGAAEGTP